MVFGFFTKKASTPAIPPENVPLPDSPVARSPNSFKAPKAHEQTQLRTPSPSIHSAAHGPNFSISPPPTVPGSVVSHDDTPALPPLEATPDALIARITTVPAKILHAYTLEQIPSASEDVIKSLATFFNHVQPPPKLHCIRCHKDFVEIENDDRSCLVPHDDESAEVERVGRNATGRRTTEGTEYETLWGCCGKVTEGNGDQGPPDGWCYEGKHTTDIKRARFRADSTPQDDKLVSCLRLNCHGIRSQMPRSTRKRARASVVKYKEATTDDEDGSEGTRDSGMEEITGQKIARKRKSIGKGSVKGKGKEKAKDYEDDKMDVDEDASQKPDETESASKAGSVRGRAPKPKSSISGSIATPASGKRRAKAPKSTKKDTVGVDETEPVASASASAPPKPRARKPKVKPKSKSIIDSSSDIEEPRGRKRFPAPTSHVGVHESASMSPERSHRNKPPRTRSQSRSRNTDVRMRVDRMDSSSPTRGSSKPTSKSTMLVSMMSDGSIVPETDDEEKEEKPRKKRKIST